MSVSKQDYGKEQYQEHLLEQYKLYVEMTDRISQRRVNTQTVFLSINAALIALFGKSDLLTLILVSISGVILSAAWYLQVENYRKLGQERFQIIYDMESMLPFAPYNVAWDKLGRGGDKKLYWPTSHLERALPIIFGLIYLTFFLYFLYCLKTGNPPITIPIPDVDIPEINIS